MMAEIDYSIINKKFGHLTVLAYDHTDKSRNTYWLCKCDCGTVKVYSRRRLVNAFVSSCGCHRREDLKNKKFNKLTAIKYVGDSKWLCKCDCGGEAVCRASALKNGHTKSCGCNHRVDIQGQRFGSLVAIEYVGNTKWRCQCDCGGVTYVPYSALARGNTKSFGCLAYKVGKDNDSFVDITGQKFGKLLALEYINRESGKSYYRFRCDCGNELVLNSYSVRYGHTKSCGCLDISHGGSSVENEIKEVLENIIGKKATKSKVLDGKEIDIFFEDLGFGVEYNGSAYHASLNSIYKDLPKTYHRDKFLSAKSKGIHLISIFDVDWCDKLKNHLVELFSSKTRIYARDCIVKTITKKEANDFCETNHLQGWQRLSSICYGLFYGDELVSVMTFGKLRNRKTNDGQFELHRYAIKHGVYVVGGAEKLFKAFTRNNGFDEIVSYSNNDLFLGTVYDRLGFKYDGQASIRYYWFLGQQQLKREECQLKHLKVKYPKLYEEAQSVSGKEDYIMTKLGARKVYRCGNTRWIYKRVVIN